MRTCIAILLLSGITQAALLSKAQDAAEAATEELSIKMPEVVAQQTTNTKPQASSSLAQTETNTELGMLESGVLHASLKSIVKAKVKKVMNFIKTNANEYEHGTAEEKKAIQTLADSLILPSTGTREYNKDLCNNIWSEQNELASTLGKVYCPTFVLPKTDLSAEPEYESVKKDPESRLRSAFLAKHFWDTLLDKDVNNFVAMLDPEVCYHWGDGPGHCGKEKVARTLPFIGFPGGTKKGDPVTWKCDTTSCIVPIKAWAEQSNYCLTTFGTNGLVKEVIVPLEQWR